MTTGQVRDDASSSRIEGTDAKSRGSRLLLPLVFLLIGAALALSFMSVDLVVLTLLADSNQSMAVRILLVGLVACAPPTIIGLIPAVRQVEATAADTLLGVDFAGSTPGPARTWDQRWRSVTWFWMHLIAGGAVGTLMAFSVTAMVNLVAHPFLAKGTQFLEISWTAVDRSLRDWIFPVLGLLVMVAAVGAVLLISAIIKSLAPAMLGASVTERLLELDNRTTHLVERTRLARELHDSVGHALSVVVLQSAAARRRMTKDPAGAADSLAAVEEVAGQALAELDEVLGLLREEDRPSSRRPLHDLGSLDGLLKAVNGTGHEVSADVRAGDVASLPPVISREAYRLVQESLTNAMRHAPGQPVQVAITREPKRLDIRVTNPVLRTPGRPALRRRGGRGLDGMRERCRMLGGSFSTRTANGNWTLHAQLPLPTKETS